MKIIIVGAYAIGTHLAELLSRNNEDVVLIDNNQDNLVRLDRDFDLLTICAEPTSIKALKDAGAEHADLLIAVTPQETVNINICVLAKNLGTKRTVAKIDSFEYLDEGMDKFFKQVGVDSLIYPEMLAAKDIISGLKMSWVRQRWDIHNGALVMLSIKLREGCTILNQPLKSISEHKEPYHIVAIRRGDEIIVPGGDDELKLYDLAYFMTTKNYIPYIRKVVGKEDYDDVKNVMIMGGGNTSVRVASTLPSYMSAKIIELDEARCEELNELLDSDTMVINGDGRDISLLKEEGIRNTQAFVAVTANVETNILACLTAKRLGVRKTVALVDNIDYISMAESLDIGTIVNKKTIAASEIYQMMLDADASNMKFIMTSNADIAEFKVQEGSKITKKKVYELGLPTGLTLGGLVRNGEGMLISGGTQIEAGDIVMVFCHDLRITKIERYFN